MNGQVETYVGSKRCRISFDGLMPPSEIVLEGTLYERRNTDPPGTYFYSLSEQTVFPFMTNTEGVQVEVLWSLVP